MKPRWIVKMLVNGQMRTFKSDLRSGGEAIAEICETLGIIYPLAASATKVQA